MPDGFAAQCPAWRELLDGHPGGPPHHRPERPTWLTAASGGGRYGLVRNSERDPLTADVSSIPRRSGGTRVKLLDCARAFAHYPSPKIIAGAIVLAFAARIAMGGWSWRDAALAVALVALEPLTEWLIHVHLLHAAPLRIGSRRVELLTTREHREHHLAPANLDGVLLPVYGVLAFLALIILRCGC